MPKKSVLTDATLAALAEAGVIAAAPAAPAEAAAPAAEAAPAEAAAPAAEAAPAEAAAPAAEAAEAAKPADSAVMVEYLQAQLAAKDALILAAAVEKKALDTKLATVEATHEGLVAVCRTSIANMRVALGGSAGDVSTLGAAEAVAEQARLASEFKLKFKVGGVAVTAPVEKEEGPAESASTGLHQARIAAAKP